MGYSPKLPFWVGTYSLTTGFGDAIFSDKAEYQMSHENIPWYPIIDEIWMKSKFLGYIIQSFWWNPIFLGDIQKFHLGSTCLLAEFGAARCGARAAGPPRMFHWVERRSIWRIALRNGAALTRHEAQGLHPRNMGIFFRVCLKVWWGSISSG